MRTRHALLALSSLPLITACSFLLDFDSLQGGNKPADAGADSGSPTAGGSSTAGASGTADESSAGASASCAGATCTN